MIIHPYKAIFVHIPKTGGTSVSKVMRKCAGDNRLPKEQRDAKQAWKSLKHSTIQNYEKKCPHPQLFKEYFKFAFVRNPWDLTFSLYNYLWRGGAAWPKRWREKPWRWKNLSSNHWSRRREPRPHERDHRISCVTPKFLEWSFEEWIKSELFLISSPAAQWCKKCNQNQIDWLLDKNDKVNVDFVGKFENFQKDFNHVCDEIGMPQQQIPHVNRGPKREHYSKYYNNETQQIVAEKYAKDIEYFEYEFEKWN